MIPRKQYIDFLSKRKDKQIIKVGTVIRRCGKSTLFELYKKQLLENGITKEQINSIYSLLDCNLEYITEEQENMFDYNYNVYNNASDAVYTRHISKKG